MASSLVNQEQDAMIYPDKLTLHAAAKIQTRCIMPEMLDHVVEYGQRQSRRSRHGSRRDPRGSWRSSLENYSFTGKTWERFAIDHPELAKQYPRCRDVYAVISDGCVITAAYCPAPRHRRRW